MFETTSEDVIQDDVQYLRVSVVKQFEISWKFKLYLVLSGCLVSCHLEDRLMGTYSAAITIASLCRLYAPDPGVMFSGGPGVRARLSVHRVFRNCGDVGKRIAP